jgi:hypothetical protein
MVKQRRKKRKKRWDVRAPQPKNYEIVSIIAK